VERYRRVSVHFDDDLGMRTVNELAEQGYYIIKIIPQEGFEIVWLKRRLEPMDFGPKLFKQGVE